MAEQLPRWTDWARELQALAQAGLEYSPDLYDRERFQRIREIAAEMVSEGSGLPLERVKDLFCGESGYQTPQAGHPGRHFPGRRHPPGPGAGWPLGPPRGLGGRGPVGGLQHRQGGAGGGRAGG